MKLLKLTTACVAATAATTHAMDLKQANEVVSQFTETATPIISDSINLLGDAVVTATPVVQEHSVWAAQGALNMLTGVLDAFLALDLVAIWESIFDFFANPTTAHDTMAWMEKNGSLRRPDAHHRAAHQEAKHSLRAQRQRLGLPKLSAGYGHGLAATDAEQIGGTTGNIVGLIQGFMYSPHADNQCSDTIMSSLIGWDNLFYIGAKFYMPWYWPEAQVWLQDQLTLTSGFYIDCKFDKAFTAVTHMITTEGLSELGGRVAGAAPFQLMDLITAFGDSEMSGPAFATTLGRFSAVVLNYHI